MNKKMTLKNIVQADKRGTLLFTEVSKDAKKPTPCTVAVSFDDPKEAAKFEQGKDYNVSITPTK